MAKRLARDLPELVELVGNLQTELQRIYAGAKELNHELDFIHAFLTGTREAIEDGTIL